MNRAPAVLGRCLLSLALVAVGNAYGASILGDSFELNGTSGGDSVTAVAGIAGTPVFTTQDGKSYDIYDEGPNYTTALAWVGPSTFDVTISAKESNNTFAGVNLTLSGLDFKSAGQPVDITGVTFDPNGPTTSGSPYVDYFFDPINNDTAPFRPSDPSVSFAPHSITVAYGSDWTSQTVADRVTLEFDVQTAAPVPEPSTAMAAIAGLALMGFAVRRRRDTEF